MPRVLGIDTSLRSTGFGVVDAEGSRLRTVEHGCLPMRASLRHSACLAGIVDGLEDIIRRAHPDSVAIEGAFFCKNARTAMILGEARGAAICACARQGLPIFEYAPRRVKQAVVGYGGAGKEQVRKMVMTLLALREEPQEDAGDALALAICHLHARTGIGIANAAQI